MFCLCESTDAEWIRVARDNLNAVLADHAHCEMKAASTAFSLALKNHQDLGVVEELVHLGHEEIEHFQRVVRFLKARGQTLGLPPVDTYASQLRKALHTLPGAPFSPVVDRLLAAALIEARSCERFKLLLENWPKDEDPELLAFYRELFECEARHYMQYRQLAEKLAHPHGALVEPRLEAIARIEGALVLALGTTRPTATVHG